MSEIWLEQEVEDPGIILCADHIGLLASWLSKEEKSFLLRVTDFLGG